MIARKYSLFVYWLLFVALTFYYAQFPGLIAEPEKWKYPWFEASIVCILLAILVSILQFILRPASYNYSWGRLFGAIVYSAIILALGAASVVTDLPGYYYVPALFSVVTMGGILLFAVIQVIMFILKRKQNAT